MQDDPLIKHCLDFVTVVAASLALPASAATAAAEASAKLPETGPLLVAVAAVVLEVRAGLRGGQDMLASP